MKLLFAFSYQRFKYCIIYLFSIKKKRRFTKVFTFDEVLAIYKYFISKNFIYYYLLLYTKIVENNENFIYKGNVLSTYSKKFSFF